jgi:HlyD family secretion protein
MAKKRKKSKVKKRIIQAAVLLAIVGGLVWYFIPSPVPVSSDEARMGSLSTGVEAQGRTRAGDRYLVWAPVAGTLPRLSLAAGDPVVRDQPLARIVPDPAALADPQTARQLNDRMAAAEAAKAQALAERDKAMAALEQARDALRSTEQLAALGQGTATQRDQAQLAVKLAFRDMASASNAVQAATFDIAAAQEALRNLKQGSALREWTVRAPRSGTVLTVAGGRTVATGAPLLEIGNPQDLEVVAETSAEDAARIRPGQRAVLTPKDAGGALEGRVRRVDMATPEAGADGAAAPQQGQVRIEFVSAPGKWQGLGDGREVGVRITTATVDNVLKVPAAAVFDDGQQASVYVVEHGKARKRLVKTGMRNADDVVIESGLKDGDRVILSPDVRIKDGVRVKTR